MQAVTRRGKAARQAERTRRRLIVGSLASGVLLLAGLVLLVVHAGGAAPVVAPAAAGPTVGNVAPDGTFTTTDGHDAKVADLHGKPTLLWFVATWCPSCQAGTPVIASHIDAFSSGGVRVVELELYGNLGTSGPDIAAFGHQYAQAAYGNPAWTWGTASQPLSLAYDPQGLPDIYYLLDGSGRITYINTAPAGTVNELLAKARQLTA